MNPHTTCKRCGWCLRVKPLVDYHMDARAKDGRVGRCKLCVSAGTRMWAALNRTQKNATDRAWKRRNRHKDRAHGAVRRALREGRLVKPRHCQSCGWLKLEKRVKGATVDWIPAPLEAHHVNYRKPLEVLWLCKRCHASHHDWGQKHKSTRRALPQRVHKKTGRSVKRSNTQSSRSI